ncbi:DNA circulation protein [Asticcacaulis biprosthecium C19]|uniref:DNA circulation protein n=1 Tax=Asticcacaulis biprosthecium C19 TaxID=715226 RepID=F4QG89_9CAUL|nr:DNA circularization N-terminal domain-containing protein [Asticcacaulis biprosthecium]EGF92417.1 DNA circulation protein [Asticcacaulis biprosthecium C19]
MAELSPWRQSLRPASFRGIEFDAIVSTRRGLGRKVAVHDFPLRDESEGEDMGAATKVFQLEAFIIGPNYKPTRDAFEAALGKAGTGLLIHPWIGEVNVRLVGDPAAEESLAEGGMVRYSLEFMREEPAALTTARPDTTAQAVTAAGAMQAQADAALPEDMKVKDQPQFVLDEAAKIVTQVSDELDKLLAPLKGYGDQLSSYVNQGLKLRSQVTSLVNQPAALAAQLSGLIHGIRKIAATPGDALNSLKVLLGFGRGFGAVSTGTPSRRAQGANQAALVAFVRHTAAAEAVAAVSEMEFAAYQDAVAVRDEMADALDDLALEAGDAGDDGAWLVLTAARSALIRDVTARGGSLARLYSYTPASTIPALVLAHRLYGAGPKFGAIADRADEIVARNRIEHPGFVRGGQVLEILSDV